MLANGRVIPQHPPLGCTLQEEHQQQRLLGTVNGPGMLGLLLPNVKVAITILLLQGR
jgi:hypothetical protein